MTNSNIVLAFISHVTAEAALAEGVVGALETAPRSGVTTFDLGNLVDRIDTARRVWPI
jgi:hypothetical protein